MSVWVVPAARPSGRGAGAQGCEAVVLRAGAGGGGAAGRCLAFPSALPR